VAGVRGNHRLTTGWRALAVALCMPLLGGCVNFWDDLTSRDFKIRSLWTKPPAPLDVIANSTDGFLRAKAFAQLKEPAQTGGSTQDQDKIVQLLTSAAREDREPLVRLAAIRTLGNFKDARAVRTLEDIYQQTRLPFNQEFNSMIRQQALVGLEQNGDDETRHLLNRVARQPGPSNEANLTDRQQTQDEKLIAIRALGRYQHPECIETLAYLLKTEKDVAIRDRAHDSLEQATGRKLPNAPGALTADLLTPAVVEEPTLIQRVTGFLKP
jgi:hypothetical protein